MVTGWERVRYSKRNCPMKEGNQTLHRREFLALGITSTASWCAGCGTSDHGNVSASPGRLSGPMEARYYDKLENNLVNCRVCPRECVIKPGDRGFCNTRENRDGTLYSLVYGKVAAFNIDPIEKKPFYHFLPGSLAYSIATTGCNFWCKFCQNWQLSQSKPEERRARDMTPDQVAREAARNGAQSIAYTYNEPTVFTEYVYDCAVEGRKRGVRSVVVSNGYINAEPLEKLSEAIAAYKVDFKAFSKTFYREVTGGERDRVLDTIKRLKRLGIWTELVHLTIPTLNDSDNDFAAIGEWIMGEVGPDVPIHFTRYHPTYRLTNLPVTPVSTLERARSIVMNKGVNFVYVGNVPGNAGNSTYCPQCGVTLIDRIGYMVRTVNMKDGTCEKCGTVIPGVWS